jgi:hypothetical protein
MTAGCRLLLSGIAYVPRKASKKKKIKNHRRAKKGFYWKEKNKYNYTNINSRGFFMKIDPLVFSAKFPDRCRLDLCRSRCCRFGVWVDIEEQETIIANQELFTPYLRPEAKDPKTWFGKTESDPDCPSGLAVETRDIAGACSFYHPAHGCVLQKGAVEAGFHEWIIKPRFCIMFPLVVSGGELTVDDDMKNLWCMKGKNRTRPILEAVRKEVEFLFDEEQRRRLCTEEESFPAVKTRGRR